MWRWHASATKQPFLLGVSLSTGLCQRESVASEAVAHTVRVDSPTDEGTPMPRLCLLNGIIIWVNTRDHLPPHFHARYGEHEAQVAIATGDVLHGSLPRSASRLVKEWTELRRAELLDDWHRAERAEPLVSIEPLP